MTDITALRYNALVDRIEKTLGNGISTYGYGQQKQSQRVTANADDITNEQMSAIYIDMVFLHLHQQGSNLPTEIALIEQDDLIIENDPENKKGIVQYENFMTTLEDNRFLVDIDTQISVESTFASSSTTKTWNQELIHEFSIQFNDANHRRHFFNAGGEIQFSAQLLGGTGLKTDNWKSLFANMGTIKFNYNRTTTTAFLPNSTITTTNKGNYDLNNIYQTVFVKTGSGTYADNQYVINAKSVNASRIDIEIKFEDNTGGIVDENVNGELTSFIQIARPNSDQVSVEAPTMTILKSFVGT